MKCTDNFALELEVDFTSESFDDCENAIDFREQYLNNRYLYNLFSCIRNKKVSLFLFPLHFKSHLFDTICRLQKKITFGKAYTCKMNNKVVSILHNNIFLRLLEYS